MTSPVLLLALLIVAWFVLSHQRVHTRQLEDARVKMTKAVSAAVVTLTTVVCATVLGVNYRTNVVSWLEGEAVEEQPVASAALAKAQLRLSQTDEHAKNCDSDHSADLANLRRRVEQLEQQEP